MFRASRDLGNPFVDPTSFDEWNLRIQSYREIFVDGKGNEFSRLFIRQKGICPVCNQGLGSLTSSNLEIHNLWPFYKNPEVLGNGNSLHKSLVANYLPPHCQLSAFQAENLFEAQNSCARLGSAVRAAYHLFYWRNRAHDQKTETGLREVRSSSSGSFAITVVVANVRGWIL
jgi:hypothetical protein